MDQGHCQMMMQGMGTEMHSCCVTMFVFGILLLIGILIVIVLQAKTVKELRKHFRSK